MEQLSVIEDQLHFGLRYWKLCAAASRPDKVSVAASFHGGGLYKANDPKSPHLGLPKIKARFYFGLAVEDNSMNAEAIAKLGKALKAWGGQHESEVYEGAHHGWTMLDNSTIRSQKSDYIGNILGLADSF